MTLLTYIPVSKVLADGKVRERAHPSPRLVWCTLIIYEALRFVLLGRGRNIMLTNRHEILLTIVISYDKSLSNTFFFFIERHTLSHKT